MDVRPVDLAVDITIEECVIIGDVTVCVVAACAAAAVVDVEGFGDDVVVETLPVELVAVDIVVENSVVICVVTECVVVEDAAVEVVHVKGFGEDVVVDVDVDVVIQVVFCASAGQFISTFAELAVAGEGNKQTNLYLVKPDN